MMSRGHGEAIEVTLTFVEVVNNILNEGTQLREVSSPDRA